MRSAYTQHAGELLGYSWRSLGDHAAAEDAVQEMFVRAWRRCHTYQAEFGSLRTWLFAIARNALVDTVRAARRRAWWPLEESDAKDLAAPVDEFERVAERQRLTAALNSLSPHHRDIVVRFYLRGHSYDELSSGLDIPLGTVKSRLYYAMGSLRAALTDLTGPESR